MEVIIPYSLDSTAVFDASPADVKSETRIVSSDDDDSKSIVGTHTVTAHYY